MARRAGILHFLSPIVLPSDSYLKKYAAMLYFVVLMVLMVITTIWDADVFKHRVVVLHSILRPAGIEWELVFLAALSKYLR